MASESLDDSSESSENSWSNDEESELQLLGSIKTKDGSVEERGQQRQRRKQSKLKNVQKMAELQQEQV